MSTTPTTEFESEPTASLPRWVVILLTVVALLVIYVAYAQWSGRSSLAKLDQVSNQVAKLEARTATLEDNYANMKGQFDVTSERVGLTQKELDRARALSRQIKEEQAKAVAALDTELDTLRAEQQSQFGSLTGEVTTVKGDVDATRSALAETQAKLERTIGDLGVQSGLIAKNSSEVDELKRRGERNGSHRCSNQEAIGERSPGHF